MGASYGGNISALMRDLSKSDSFKSTLVVGGTRDIAHNLINKLVGSAAAANDRAWAVDWFVSSYQSGKSWGEIMFEAVSALDLITSGPWAAAANQMRARSDYNVKATEGWAANMSDLSSMQDVYSAAITPMNYPFNIFNPLPIVRLEAASSSLLAGANSLPGQSAGTSYTVNRADLGKSIFIGQGNDTVIMPWQHATETSFISGGAGFDTLVMTDPDVNDGMGFTLNNFGGLYDDRNIRGFEKIVYTGWMPYKIGSIDGVKEFSLSSFNHYGYAVGFDSVVYSVDNNTVFNIDMKAGGGGVSALKFLDVTPYNNVGKLDLAASQVVDNLTFNVKGAQTGVVRLDSPPAKNVTINVDAPAGSQFRVDLVKLVPGSQIYSSSFFPLLENLKYSSPLDWRGSLESPLKGLDLSGSTGKIALNLVVTGPQVADGVPNPLNVNSSKGVMAIKFAPITPKTDTYINFIGDMKAGSNVIVDYGWVSKISGLPVVKTVFNSDFSEINHFKNAGGTGFKPNEIFAGSVFNVKYVEKSAVYFKGVAPAGQTIGTVVNSDFANTTIKVDAAFGINFEVGTWLNSSVTTFIKTNNQGNILDTIKSSIIAKTGDTLQDIHVDGGRIIFRDYDGNGKVGGNMAPTNHSGAWMGETDFIVMETTTDNLAKFNVAITLMGLTPVVDYFA